MLRNRIFRTAPQLAWKYANRTPFCLTKRQKYQNVRYNNRLQHIVLVLRKNRETKEDDTKCCRNDIILLILPFESLILKNKATINNIFITYGKINRAELHAYNARTASLKNKTCKNCNRQQ